MLINALHMVWKMFMESEKKVVLCALVATEKTLFSSPQSQSSMHIEISFQLHERAGEHSSIKVMAI